MGFQFSDRSQELQLRISKFLDDHIYPAEEVYAQQMQEFTEQGDRWQIPQIIEDKKEIAKEEGANILVGGNRIFFSGRIKDGYFMEPTILNNVKQEMTVAREEIFGPVLSILEYEDQDEAIKIANDTDYGLGAGVFTKDLKKASWTASKLEAGQVYVNKWFLIIFTSFLIVFSRFKFVFKEN